MSRKAEGKRTYLYPISFPKGMDLINHVDHYGFQIRLPDLVKSLFNNARAWEGRSDPHFARRGASQLIERRPHSKHRLVADQRYTN